MRLKDKAKTRQNNIVDHGGYIELPLTLGYKCLIDKGDWERVKEYNWFSTHKGYAGADIKGHRQLLHRFIMGLNIGDERQVDHISGDTSDNRRSNLRICSKQDNTRNTKSHKNSSSKYKGVSWDRGRNKWRSIICTKNSYLQIGRFDNEEEAARAYDAKAKELHGEFAHLNFKY